MKIKKRKNGQKRIESKVKEKIRNKEVIIYKMNIQIIKKRLRELKQLSQNIKKGTQNRSDEEHNLNLIRIVIEKTKNISTSSPHLKQNNLFVHHQSLDQLPQTPNNNKNKDEAVSNKHIVGVGHKSKQATRQKYLSKLTKIQSKSYQQQSSPEQQNQQNISRKNSQANSRKSNRAKISLQQISHIIQQNKCLAEEILAKDQTIRALRQQIQGLNKEKQKTLSNHHPQESEDQHQHFKCFKINLLTNVFVTSLCVDQKDHNRIEYDSCQLKLSLNSILIKQTKDQRKSMISSTSSNKRKSVEPKRNTTTKTTINKNLKNDKQKFDLSDLQSVQYIDQLVILMKFKDDQNERFVYVKFHKYEELHEWDIGLYINYTIVKSLGQQNIFEKNNPFLNTIHKQRIAVPVILQKQAQQKIQTKYKKITKNKKIDNVQKQLILEYLHKQYAYKNIRKTIMENNLNNKFLIIDQSNRSSNGSYHDRKSLDTNQVYHQILYPNDEVPSNEKVSNGRATKQMSSQNKQLERLRQLEQMQRQKQLKKQAQLEAKRLKIAKRKDQKRQKEQQIRKSIKFLKDGLFLTKYAEGALNPYKKRVFLSEDELKLCWHNKGQKQKQSKYIEIKQIKSVEIGQIGPGIQKHIQKNKIKNLKQFMVIKLDGKNRKTLQFGELENQKLVQTFVKNLNIFMKSKTYSVDLSIDQQQSLILF